MPTTKAGLSVPDNHRAIALFEPLPWQIAPWRDKSPNLLLAGPAGTGKSRLAGEKVHAYLLKYPGATGMVLRKTRESMTNSTLLFLARTIIGRDPRVRLLKYEHRFEYWNGSVLAYGGMKDEEQREQVRGIGVDAGVDIAWLEEAVRFVRDDKNEVDARMRGKAAPWQQLILSTNPGPPSHWINQEMILGGGASVYDKARPEDNPYNPPAYIERLKLLTGILRQRLWEGLWVQAEGLVYEEFDLDNLTDDEPGPDLPFELAFDDGYVDPRAILFIQKQPGKILVFDEIYHTRHLAEKCVHETLEACALHSGSVVPPEMDGVSLTELATWCRTVDGETGQPNARLPEIAVGSPEAKELQERLRRADIPARGRSRGVVEGIAAVRDLICDGNGYRTLRVNRRCKNLIREITEGYHYPEGATRDNEKPMDGNDHACFVAGTMILTQMGKKPIEMIQPGEMVWTRYGYREVIASSMTTHLAEVLTVTFSNGVQLTGTANHPVFVSGKSYIPLRALRYGDMIVTPELEVLLWQKLRQLYITGLRIIATHIQSTGLIECITNRIMGLWQAAKSLLCTARYGLTRTGLFQRPITFTIKMAIRSTILWITWRWFKDCLTLFSTVQQSLMMSAGVVASTWNLPVQPLSSGTGLRLDGSGRGLLANCLGLAQNQSRQCVNIVTVSFRPWQDMGGLVFALIIAHRAGAIIRALTTKTASALVVGLLSRLTALRKSVIVPVRVLHITASEKPEAVYNLTVDSGAVGKGEYFANGILVHNCEALSNWVWLRARR